MHLDNFVEIISGKFLNSHCLSSINKVTSKINNIQKGDAFILINKDDAKEALNRGAYAIVVDNCVDIIDNEIAWILVSDIEMSILKFVKYIKLINSIDIYRFDDISLKIAKNIIRDDKIGIASNVYELLESLHKKCILINFDILLFEILYLQNYNQYLFDIIKKTLFEAKINFNNESYNLTIPNIFLQELNNVISFCKQMQINIILHLNSELFLPIFITNNAHLSKYTRSMRFIYSAVDTNLIKRYIEFVNNAKWGKSLCLTNNYYNDIECKNFIALESLRDFFVDPVYHFFIVDGVNCDYIKELLVYNNDTPLLFDE